LVGRRNAVVYYYPQYPRIFLLIAINTHVILKSGGKKMERKNVRTQSNRCVWN